MWVHFLYFLHFLWEIFFVLFVFVVFGGKGFVLDLKIQDKFYCVACKDEGQIFSSQSDQKILLLFFCFFVSSPPQSL